MAFHRDFSAWYLNHVIKFHQRLLAQLIYLLFKKNHLPTSLTGSHDALPSDGIDVDGVHRDEQVENITNLIANVIYRYKYIYIYIYIYIIH